LRHCSQLYNLRLTGCSRIPNIDVLFKISSLHHVELYSLPLIANDDIVKLRKKTHDSRLNITTADELNTIRNSKNNIKRSSLLESPMLNPLLRIFVYVVLFCIAIWADSCMI